MVPMKVPQELRRWSDPALRLDQERQRIKITLNRPPRLNMIAREHKLNGPIDSDRINCNTIKVTSELSSGAARKANDPCSGNLLAHRIDNARAGLNTPFSKFLGRQTPAQLSKICTVSTPAATVG